jgi:hypothetical protein
MGNDNIVAEFELTDGLIISVRNTTSHYYGGYFHVRLQATADILLSVGMFDSQALFDQVKKQFGRSLRFERVLEKMAVPESEVESVGQSLLTSFENNVLPYLSRKDFPLRFVLSEYAKYLKSGTISRGK